MSKFPGDLLKNVKQALNKAAAGVATDANIAAKDAKMAASGISKDAKQASSIADKLVSGLVHDAGDTILAPLIPLKNGMKAAIKTAKYPDANPPDDTLSLAKEFVKKVIQNEQFESLEYFAKGRAANFHASPVVKKTNPVSKTTTVSGKGNSVITATNSQQANTTFGGTNTKIGTTSPTISATNAQMTALQNAALAAIQQAAQAGMAGSGGGGDGGTDNSSEDSGSDDSSSDGIQSDQENDNNFTASGGDDNSSIDFSQDDDMPGSSGASDYAISQDDWDYGDQADEQNDEEFESLEKQVKYGLDEGINSGFRDEFEEERPGSYSFEDLQYLDGACDKEKTLYLQYKDIKNHLSMLEAYETFESLTDTEAGTAEAAAPIAGAAIGTIFPGVGTALGASVGALVALIIKWFQDAHDAKVKSAQQAAAIAAANAQWNSMSQAQQNTAMGTNPFSNWFSNPDGSRNNMHIFEAFLGIAAIGLILVSILNTD
jgi:hypothetical protein